MGYQEFSLPMTSFRLDAIKIKYFFNLEAVSVLFGDYIISNHRHPFGTERTAQK